MPKSLPSVIVLVAVLTALSGLYAYLRAATLTPSNQLESKTLSAARRDTAVFYAGLAVAVGIISYFVFRAMHNSSPDSAERQFLLLAVGIGIVLEFMALAVFKTKSLLDFTVLHLLFITSYGWLLPQIFPV